MIQILVRKEEILNLLSISIIILLNSKNKKKYF